jgi:Sigma-70 region 2
MTWLNLERGDPVVQGGGSAAVSSSETFEEFYAREFPAVVGLAFALSGSRTASEDFAQEAFLAAHRDWARVAGYERPDLWVRRVVSNLSMSMFRRRYAEARALARSPFGPRTRCRSCLTMTQSSGRPSDPCGDGRRRSSRSVTWKTIDRRDRGDPRHRDGHGEEATARRSAEGP